MNTWVSVLILTRNEELHIQRCVESAKGLTPFVFVVDSCSSDKTAEIATSCGATVIAGTFDNFADKLNWSLDNVEFPTPWVLRLDADEVLIEGFVDSINHTMETIPDDVSGIYVRRQLWFMGRWMKHGGMYPTYSMRLWRNGHARSEVRDLDEYMILSRGIAITLNVDIIDNPLTNLAAWVDKHNRYSSLEARVALTQQANQNPNSIIPTLWGSRVERMRWVKLYIFYRLPLFIRPILYFLYRYIIRLGFLDGREGFLFHFMHGLWYRVLVDGKIFEQRKNS